MKQIIILLITISLLTAKENPIKHVIHIGMENHSFDNMLGYLEGIGDLNENEYCNEFKGFKYCTRKEAAYQTSPDPPHNYKKTNWAEFGTKDFPPDNSKVPDNSGFAMAYDSVRGYPQNVFDCYTPEQVPIITTLAKNFKVCNNWFSSLPSSTIPNKFFYHAASSNGVLANPSPLGVLRGDYPIFANTIEQNLAAENHTAEIHWMDWNEAWGIYPLGEQLEHAVFDYNFTKFYKQLDEGTLSEYTHLIPSIFWGNLKANSKEDDWEKGPNTQHPDEDVRAGELLIKRVYEALRNSQYWENTVLVISYDESGGFFDHVPSPGNVQNPSPDAKCREGFQFDRLGGRIPAIVISPWLAQGIDSTQYEHASIPHTLKEVFQLKSDYLNIRDQEANSFITLDELLDQPRQDCPTQLPDVPGFDKLPYQYKKGEYEFGGSHRDTVVLIGQMLIRKGMISEELFEEYVNNVIKTEQDVKGFLAEGQIALGLREYDLEYDGPNFEIRFLHKKYFNKDLRGVQSFLE